MAGSLKKLAERIELDNDRFNKLSNAEKKVEIARDCIERINLKQFNINTGSTVDFWSYDKYDNFIDLSIKDIINSRKLPECNVCAKGGLFMSYVGRVNECNFSDVEDSSGLDSFEMEKLQEIFEPMQLDLIELAFESDDICYEDFYETEEGEELKEAAINYKNNIDCYQDDLVLKSICKNIIKNKGEFVPTDLVSPNAKIK